MLEVVEFSVLRCLLWSSVFGDVFTVFSRCFYDGHGVYGKFTVFTVFPRYLINGIFSGIFPVFSGYFRYVYPDHGVTVSSCFFFSSYSETSIS